MSYGFKQDHIARSEDEATDLVERPPRLCWGQSGLVSAPMTEST